MPAALQLLSKTTTVAKFLQNKPAVTDEGGDQFKAELNRASDRKKNDAADSSTDPSNDSTDSAKDAKQSQDADKSNDTDKSIKAEKSHATKKSHASGKARKSPPAEQKSGDVTDEAAATTEESDAAKAAKLALPDVSPAELPADDAGAAPVDASKAVTTGKDQPTDASAVAIALPIQPQAKTGQTETSPDGSAAKNAPGSITPTIAKVAQPTSDAESAAQSQADAAAASVTDPGAVAGPNTPGIESAVSPLSNSDELAIQPKQSTAKKTAPEAAAAPADDAATIAQYFSDLVGLTADKPHDDKSSDDSAQALAAVGATATKPLTAGVTNLAKPEQPAPPPETRFADVNHPEIVKGIATQLLPRGGTMQLRLDPPELGALQVTLSMKDGVMNATFQTSNDDATRLLSHSMTQLKTAMESAGISVDKLQVQHTPKDSQSHTAGEDQGKGQTGQDDLTRQQEQQRKDMIKRMWRKLSGENDPLDLVA